MRRRKRFEPRMPRTTMSPREPLPNAAEADPGDLPWRADAIGRAPVFRSWPAPARLRLARAATVATHAPGALVVEAGPTTGALTVIVDGTAVACVTGAEGRRVTFMIASAASVHGLVPFVDGREMHNDVIALDTVRVIRIPHDAVRAELQAAPVLWESVAIDLADRAWRITADVKRFVFDQPRVHLAVLLTGLAGSPGADPAGQPVQIEQRMSQELIAEMLGISRQWASTLVRDLVADGVLRWRYGRVTVLDFERLRELAGQGINARGELPRRGGPAQRPGTVLRRTS
jgi:CRP-like cAMP-binding protein